MPSIITDKTEIDNRRENQVYLWVTNIPEVVDSISEEAVEPIQAENVHKCNSQNTDIKILYNTLKNVLLSVKTPNKVISSSEKMMARQVVEKDFSYFPIGLYYSP